jgi:hypothetical protein
MPKTEQKLSNNRVQRDAAGAAPNLGAFLTSFPARALSRSSKPASGAADAEFWTA